MTGVYLQQVVTRRDRDLFIDIPNIILGGFPNFTPQIHSMVRDIIDPRVSPFMRDNPSASWIAWADGKPAGRIMAIEDRAHLATHRDGRGHFGFLDAIDDQRVFSALLDRASEWLRQRGLTQIAGPFSPSINYESGLLIQGDGERASIGMNQAPAYYQEAVEALGFRKLMDLFSFRCATEQVEIPARIRTIIERAEGAGQLRLRPMRMSRLTEDVELLIDIYNDGWASNWSAVPMTNAEARRLASEVRPLIKSPWIQFVEMDGEAVAAVLMMPDLNEAIADMNGRLLPLGWLKLLWRMRRPTVRGSRLLLMGVRKSLHGSALSFVAAMMLIDRALRVGREYGLETAELGWILESNRPVLAMFERFLVLSKKVYRIYGKPV